MPQHTVCARCGDTRGIIQLEFSGIASGMCLPCFRSLQGTVDALGSQFLQRATDTTLVAIKDVSDQKDALDPEASAWLTSEVLFYYLHLADRDAFARFDDQLRVLFSRSLADTALVKLIAGWGIGKNDPRYNEAFQKVRNGLNSRQLEFGHAPPTDVAGAFRDTLSRLLAKEAPSAHAALAAATVERASDNWQHIAPALQVAIAATQPPSARTPPSLSPASPASPAQPMVPSHGTAGLVARLWRGELSLPVTFWAFGFVPNFVIGLLLAALSTRTSQLARGVTYLYLGYYALMVIAIWRSSERYTGPKVWRVLARVMVMLGVLRTLVGIFAGP